MTDQEPEWLKVLRDVCTKSSQAAVAARIGYSATVVNQVLKGKYTGDLQAVEQAVRGALLSYTVACPVLGALPAHLCLEHQRRPFAATNPLRVKLYRACRTCEHRR